MTHREAKGILSDIKIRMQEIKNFYIHLAAYVGTNGFFTAVNIFDGPDGPLVLAPIVLWGALLYRHSRKVFGRKGSKSAEWEKDILRDLLDGELPIEEEELLLNAHSEKEVLRMKKRLENLEAIISSKKWDEIEEDEKVSRNRRLVENISDKV